MRCLEKMEPDKSTLMNVLTGVHARDAGTIEFDGKEV